MDDPGSVFTVPIGLRWADLDPNGHVRHSVYYDWGAMARIAFLERQGVGLGWMTRNAIGPVLFREEARFMRELRLGDDLHIDVRLAAASPDGRKWRMRHRILRGDELTSTVEVDGAWIDLKARKIAVPPAEIVRAFAPLARTEDFAVLPSGKGAPDPASGG
jgi:acyl-CoA thioester hydrolase